jgi:hypothetical protein
MTSERITLDRAIETARQVVADKGPTHRHKTATFVTRDVNDEYVPSCINGHILTALGVPAEAMYKYGFVDTLSRDGVISIERDALIFLSTLQCWADQGIANPKLPWGRALEVALDETADRELAAA